MDLTSRRKIKPATRGTVEIGRRRRIGRKRKKGAHAESLRVVGRVQVEVITLLEREPEPEGGGEGGGRREKHRVLQRFKKDLQKLVGGLSGFIPEDNATMDTLQHAMFDVDDAANAYGDALDDDGALDVPDARAFAKHVAVSKLAAIRGLDSKEAYAAFLKHVDVVAEWRRERAAFFKERREEGYTDRQGKEHSPAEIASKKEREAARRADPMASRTSATGFGLGDEESNNKSMRREQDRKVRALQRNPHRQRDAVDAVHKERNAPPPPPGADRVVGGYKARSYLVPQGEPNPATWDRAEIERRVAEFRERTGVPELDRTEYGTHVRRKGDGWKVKPPVAMRRPLKMTGDPKEIYCAETRSFIFSDKDEADVALEKFMASSTSDDERKKMLYQPPEAVTCAYCDHAPWKTIQARVMHEKYHCKSRPDAPESSSSSSEEEESDEDESEEVEPEEAVAPPPKRARFFSWPWRSSE